MVMIMVVAVMMRTVKNAKMEGDQLKIVFISYQLMFQMLLT